MNLIDKRYRVRGITAHEEWPVADAASLSFAREIVDTMRSAQRADAEFRIWDTIDECWVTDDAEDESEVDNG